MNKDGTALPGNTLNHLILKALDAGADHGYGVARWVERVTEDVLSLEEGSLYPALHRLEKRGMLESRWGVSENNRRAKFYQLTPAGRTELSAQDDSWARLAGAMSKVVAAASEGV